jgi:flagellar biosynthesis protein FlhB
VVLVALVSPVMLGGLVFSAKSLQPKFSKLNPLPGIARKCFRPDRGRAAQSDSQSR